MIYYFSGTGNSRWVAKKIGKKLNEDVVNIIDINKSDDIHVKEGEIIGFVCPTYAWLPAEIMLNFIKKLSFEKCSFSFLICTCDSEAGNIGKLLKKNYSINSVYSIDMPNNYIISSDVDSKEVIDSKLENAEKIINQICIEVSNKNSVCKINKGSFSVLKTKLVAPLFNKYARNTKSFTVENSCVSCGLCQDICSVDCIKLVDGKPFWGNYCLQCLACIHRCPKKAIQYGKKSKKFGRYYLD